MSANRTVPSRISESIIASEPPGKRKASSILHVWEPVFGQPERAEREKVVYHHVVRLVGLYTVIATEKPGPLASTVYYLYWGAVQHLHKPTSVSVRTAPRWR
jgi:hypothetical protein